MVGYRTPPTHSRFKKGQSGNPKGRPKKPTPSSTGPTSVDAITLQHAERLIDVRDGTEVRKVSVLEAVSLAQVKTAINGSPYAQRDVLARYHLADLERRRIIAEECELWEQYVDIKRKQIASAEARGEPPPKVLPHPDDIKIDYEKGARVRGPLDEDEEAQLQGQLKMLDILLMQDALDRRKHKNSRLTDPDDQPGAAMLYMHFFNEFLPVRYQLEEEELVNRFREYQRLNIRTLEKVLYRAWRSIGVNMRRGQTFGTVGRAKQVLNIIADEMRKLQRSH